MKTSRIRKCDRCGRPSYDHYPDKPGRFICGKCKDKEKKAD